MTSSLQTPVLTPPRVYPACSEPGYVMTLTLGGEDYQIFAYSKEANGAKNYLPSSCRPQAFEKIRSLAWGLANAHETRRASLNEAHFEINTLNSAGLKKSDNSLVSHDFLVQPLSSTIAEQMASAISLSGHPMQATALKAQDIWNSLERTIREEMERTTNSTQPSTSNNLTSSSAVSTLNPQTAPPSSPISAPEPQTAPIPASIPTPPPSPALSPAPAYRTLTSATDLNLRNIPLNQPDWYEQIPNRVKLRIITEILERRCPQGGIYERVWRLFESKLQLQPPSSMIDLLTNEKNQLSLKCRATPSPITASIRREAGQIITAFQQNPIDESVQEKILTLMEKEFECKEKLFQCIRWQAEAEGIAIADWDQHWAQYHFLENTYRFVHALAHWLDSN